MRPSAPAIAAPKGPPVVALILATCAALTLAVTTFVHGWLDSGVYDVRLGLRGGTVCLEHGCESVSVTEVVEQADRNRSASATNDCIDAGLEACNDGPDLMACQDKVVATCAPSASGRGRTFVIAGWVTSVCLWLGVLGLLAAIGLVLAKATPALPIAPTTISFLTLTVAIVSGCVFVATKPGGTGMLGIGWAFWIFAAGTVAGITASMLLARAMRPAVGDWDPGDAPPDDDDGVAPAWDALTPPPK